MSRLRVGFGSYVAVEATAIRESAARDGVAAAFAAVADVERLMHPTHNGSDLAALNACGPERPLTVHPWTWQVLKLSQQLHRLSQGAFDPCVPASSGRISHLRLLPHFQVMVQVPVYVDLGGIAKGYAVDRAIDALTRHGCHAGLVNAGGDLRVFGADARQIVCRDASGRSYVLTMSDKALASSDTRAASRPPEHLGYYDAKQQRITATGSATVIAGQAAIADALTKCLLLGDEPSECTLLARLGATRVQLG